MPQWYSPTQLVVNSNKLSKIRFVCNAAARFAENSFIEALVPGPDLLSDLIVIPIRFRWSEIGLSVDIEAMFMQVEVSEYEQRFLRFSRRGVVLKLKCHSSRHIFGWSRVISKFFMFCSSTNGS